MTSFFQTKATQIGLFISVVSYLIFQLCWCKEGDRVEYILDAGLPLYLNESTFQIGLVMSTIIGFIGFIGLLILPYSFIEYADIQSQIE